MQRSYSAMSNSYCVLPIWKSFIVLTAFFFLQIICPIVVLYFVTVYTSDVRYAGTDLKVDILLAGTAGDSGEVELESTDKVPDPFERGT